MKSNPKWFSTSVIALLMPAFISLTILGNFGCAHSYLRTPSLVEKKHFVFSKNIDRAVIDANEKGPLQMLSMLSDPDHDVQNPLDLIQKQKGLIEGDLILAGYDDQVDDLGMPELSSGEKSQAVLITVVIVSAVLIGAAIPILMLLDVF